MNNEKYLEKNEKDDRKQVIRHYYSFHGCLVTYFASFFQHILAFFNQNCTLSTRISSK